MESKGALLTVAVPLLAFKVWFAILLLTYAPTRDTVVWIAATHWTLLFILPSVVVASIAGYRMLRGRAKRAQLRREEFMLAPEHPHGVGRLLRPASDRQCSALWDTVSRLEGGD